MTRNLARRGPLALLALGALVFGGNAYASGHGRERTIRLVEASAVPHPTVIDLDKPGLSTGDHVIIRDGVIRPAGGRPGVLREDCTLVDVGTNLRTGTYECSGSIDLPEGTLTFQGPFVPAAPAQAQAITGGTGEFAAAAGEAIVRAEADRITVRLIR